MKKTSLDRVFLLIIVLLAAFLRLYKLGEVPPGIISDEASIGYNAYSILKTGKDEWGNFLPLSFPAFGDYKLPGYIYATVPAVAVFGLNEFAVRLPSAVFGILTVLATYFLVLELFKSNKIAFLSSLFLAVSPWHLQVSRMAIEANMAIFFVVVGLLFFLKSLQKINYLLFSFLAFLITFYIYNSHRVFVPFFLLALLLIFRTNFKKYKSKITVFILIAIILSAPIAKHFVTQSFTGRLSKVGIFFDPGITNQIIEERDYCSKKAPKIICYGIFNKPIKFTQVILKNYFSHYSVGFLFLSGSDNLKHYSLPNFGEMYIFQLPFLFLGILFLLKKFTHPSAVLFAWLILYPSASFLTSTAHTIRGSTALPIFEIIAAFGLVHTLQYIQKKIIFILLVVIPAVLFLNEYFFLYYNKYSKEFSQAFQYGYKEGIKFAVENQNPYLKVVFSKKIGDPYIFYLFYEKIDPLWYQTSPEVERIERSDKWKEVIRIGKYYFKDFSKERPKRENGSNILYVLHPDELNEPLTPTKTIMSLDGTAAIHFAH